MPYTVPDIDVAVLSRDTGPLQPAVAEAIARQRGVRIQVHRVIGAPLRDDTSRMETITRARNEAIARARSPWLMYVDDDVVIADDCVARLHHALAARTDFGGLGADYLGESRRGVLPLHVSMGATLFRRDVLHQAPFRWQPDKCECRCRCDDLRRTGARIDYLRGARAWHLRRATVKTTCDSGPRQILPTDTIAEAPPSAASPKHPVAKILVAFNRRDVKRFRAGFLRTLRAAGNRQQVIAVGYGLYASEIGLLRSQPGVRVVSRSVNGKMPPVRRLEDFARIASDLDPATPLAYWDAADVLFQGDLSPLWRMTHQHRDKLLAVREPRGYPQNQAVVGWTRTIRDPAMRRQAFELFATRPFLNSGFAAGTAGTMARYFATAWQMRHSDRLRGTTDWGDQSALNLYCHTDPERWQEISDCWNYCVHDRPRGETRVLPSGLVADRNGSDIRVVHGNAKSLAQMALLR